MTSAPESGTAPAPPRPSWLDELCALLPIGRVSTRTDDLLCYRRDAWARGLLAIAAGQPPGPLPAAIVWPRSIEEVEAIVRHCRRHRVPLVPFGAGSGVTGGAAPSEGGLTMDMKGLRALRIDPERMQIAVEPGLNGWHLEDALQARGLTLGHFPSSIMCSTVGGWVATRGAGQMSTKYGKIEDMVRALTVVTGDGQRRRLGDGGDGGIDLVQALIGSEGTLGVITEAVCSVRRAPAARVLRGYWFPDVESGLYGIRHLVQHGLVPAVVRLYDEIDTLIAGMGRGHISHHGPRETGAGLDLSGTAARLLHSLSERVGKIDLGAPGRPALDLEELVQLLRPDARRARGLFERWATQLLTSTATPVNRLLDALLPRFQVGCVLILGCEGEPELAEAEASYAREELTKLGARDLGPEPGERWLRKRYDVSFKQQKMYAAGALVDTIEVAATWDRLPLLHRQVRNAIGQHALVMAHFSHAYPDGCSIYFSFVMRAQSLDNDGLGERARLARLEQDRRRYDTLWRAAMTAALHAGGTISHHHGIGRVRAPFMAAEHGDSVHLLAALKRAADPDGILNPGKLLPPELSGPPAAGHPDATGKRPGEGAGAAAAERPQRGARIGPIQPDGLLVVPPGGELEFLHPLPVRRLWGVGVKTEARLADAGIETVGDLAALGEENLARLLGRGAGRHLYALSMARDPRRVETGRRRKSIGAQRALGRRIKPESDVEETLIAIVDGLGKRLRGAHRLCRTVVLRLRFDDFERVTRSRSLREPTESTAVILAVARGLFDEARPLIRERGATLIGLSLTNLCGHDAVQLVLPFEISAPGSAGGPGPGLHAAELDVAVDDLRTRFGRDAVTRGRLLHRHNGDDAPMLPD